MTDRYQPVRFTDPEGNAVAEAMIACPEGVQPGPVADVPVTHDQAAQLRQAFTGSDLSVRREAVQDAIGPAGLA